MSQIPDVIAEPVAANWSDGAFVLQMDNLSRSADVFPHDATGLRFGKPTITAGEGTQSLVRFTTTTEGETPPSFVTLRDGTRAFTVPVSITNDPLASADARSIVTWLMAAAFAFLGGLILNIMPCVLPVLSIKFAGVLAAAGQSLRDIRAGFMATAAGILTFALGLAGIVIALRSLGGSFGLGVQFQSPVFLTFMIAILTLFAINLFGLFEFRLPQSWTQSMDDRSRKEGLVGDFLTGVFAALLATPCSAPFLGSAVSYAFSGSAFDALTVFLFLGIGLATPYLLAAARPGLLKALPKPGPWMQYVRALLGLGVAATAIWLTFILSASTGVIAAVLISGAIAMALLLWSVSRTHLPIAVSVTIALLAILAPLGVPAPQAAARDDMAWSTFDAMAIAQHIADGHTVFVDVTADWCLTCKVNKSLVLDAAEVIALLERDDVIAMRADWTRPNEAIRAYLEGNDRFGIPFNIVYGPDAPEGIALPELLSISGTRDAIATAHPLLER